MTPHTIPVTVLLRAAAALKAAKDLPVQTTMPISTWTDVMRAYCELHGHLDLLLAGQAVPINAS